MPDDPTADRGEGFDGPDRSAPSELAQARAELAATRSALEASDLRARRAEEREQQLWGELQHGMRNTLALVRSIFSRTIETGVSLEEVEMHFVGRLNVLSTYQPIGLPGARAGTDLEILVRDELRNFQFGAAPRILVDGPDVILQPDHVQPFALAIHELVTNAMKFGALSVSGAELHIRWAVASETLDFEWSETGVPVVVAVPMRRGFSREYIEEALPYQIGAETHFELRPGGVLCRIRLPLSAAPERRG